MTNSKTKIHSLPTFDHFHEHIETPYRAHYHLLGSHYSIESNDPHLIHLTSHAFTGVPKHHFHGHSRRFRIRLILEDIDANPGWPAKGKAPVTNMYLWNGVFCKTMGPDTVLIINPQSGSAQIVVSKQMMAFPYNVRYQLIQYAVVFLAQRSEGLISLNAACIALNGKGIVLIGDNAAGKSTTSLACLIDGFEFIAEEGLVVCPNTLRVSGLSSFLHLRPDCLRFFRELKQFQNIRKFPKIMRRNVVLKLEIDTRKLNVRLARSSVEIRALVFLSGRKASTSNLVKHVTRDETRDLLEKSQPYVTSLPRWRSFFRKLSGVPAYTIARGDHPKHTVAAIRGIFNSV